MSGGTIHNQVGTISAVPRHTKLDGTLLLPGPSEAGIQSTRNIETTQLGRNIATFNSPFGYKLAWEAVTQHHPLAQYFAGIERVLLADVNKEETELDDWADRLHKLEVNLGIRYGFLRHYESSETANGKTGKKIDWAVDMDFALTSMTPNEIERYSPPVLPISSYGPVFRTLYIPGTPSPTRVSRSWGSARSVDLTLNGSVIMSSPFVDAGLLSFSWQGPVDAIFTNKWYTETAWSNTWDYVFTQYTHYAGTVEIHGVNPATGVVGLVASGFVKDVAVRPRPGLPVRVDADITIALNSRFI